MSAGAGGSAAAASSHAHDVRLWIHKQFADRGWSTALPSTPPPEAPTSQKVEYRRKLSEYEDRLLRIQEEAAIANSQVRTSTLSAPGSFKFFISETQASEETRKRARRQEIQELEEHGELYNSKTFVSVCFSGILASVSL